MPYFQCPGCGTRVHEPSSYLRYLACPVCARTLAEPKTMPWRRADWLRPIARRTVSRTSLEIEEPRELRDAS